MRTLTVTRWTGPPVTDRPSTRGRWIWTLTGLATIGLLAWPVVGLISRAGNGGQGEFISARPTMTRTLTVTQPVTSLSVESYGAPIQVTAGLVGISLLGAQTPLSPFAGADPKSGAGLGLSSSGITIVVPSAPASMV